MKLRTVKIIGIFVIFLLCFPFHFLYDLLPNGLTSIFFPVNESIWEHMKLILSSYLLYSLIEYFILKKHNLKNNNFLLQTFLMPLITIVLYLLIFIPIYKLVGENMVVSIGLLFIVIIIEQIISYYLLSYREIKYQNIIGIVGIILLVTLFGYFTYKPMENFLFFDTKNSKYGINVYQK